MEERINFFVCVLINAICIKATSETKNVKVTCFSLWILTSKFSCKIILPWYLNFSFLGEVSTEILIKVIEFIVKVIECIVNGVRVSY